MKIVKLKFCEMCDERKMGSNSLFSVSFFSISVSSSLKPYCECYIYRKGDYYKCQMFSYLILSSVTLVFW